MLLTAPGQAGQKKFWNDCKCRKMLLLEEARSYMVSLWQLTWSIHLCMSQHYLQILYHCPDDPTGGALWEKNSHLLVCVWAQNSSGWIDWTLFPTGPILSFSHLPLQPCGDVQSWKFPLGKALRPGLVNLDLSQRNCMDLAQAIGSKNQGWIQWTPLMLSPPPSQIQSVFLSALFHPPTASFHLTCSNGSSVSCHRTLLQHEGSRAVGKGFAIVVRQSALAN